MELPDDVRRLVIAAREVFDAVEIDFPEVDALDKALEPFSALVPYENQPDTDCPPAQAGADRLSDDETARASSILDLFVPLSIASTWGASERRTIVRAMLAYGDVVAGIVNTARDEEQAGAASGEVDRLMHVIDRDRYAAAACLNAIDFVLHTRRWLREAGRGSYAYDDERYQQEFGLAFDEIMEAMRPMRALAKDKTDCTTDPEKVSAARTAGSERFAALSTPKASAETSGAASLAREPATADVGREMPSAKAIADLLTRLRDWAPGLTAVRKDCLEAAEVIAALSRAAPSGEPCGYCGVDPCRCDATDLCEAPGCDNKTDRGICDACDQWVSDQVAAPSSEPAIAEGEREEYARFADAMLARLFYPSGATRDDAKPYQIARQLAKAVKILATTPPTTNDAIPAGMKEALKPFLHAAEAILHNDRDRWQPDEWTRRAHLITVGQYRALHAAALSAAPSAPATEAGEKATYIERRLSEGGLRLVSGSPTMLSDEFARYEAERTGAPADQVKDH